MRVDVIKAGFEMMRSCVTESSFRFNSGTTSRVKRAVNATLKLISSNAPQSELKINGLEMLQDLKSMVSLDARVAESAYFKAFLVSLKEFGLEQTNVLVDILFELLDKGTSQEVLTHFVETFPEIKDAVDAQGRGVLSRAISSNLLLDDVENLIDLGFSLSLVNASTGNSILHDLASKADLFPDKDCDTYAQFILKVFDAQIDVNLKNAAGNTALHESLLHQNAAIFQSLVTVSDIEVEDSNGRRASHLCFLGNRAPGLDYYNLLHEKGEVELDPKDSFGDTPLHMACRYSKKTNVYIRLVDLGVDIEVKNAKGLTPYEMLADNSNLRPTETSFIASEMIGVIQDPEKDQSIDLSDKKNRARLLFKLFVLEPDTPLSQSYIDQLFDLAFQNNDTNLFKFLIIWVDSYEVLEELFMRIVSEGRSEFLKLYLESNFYISEFDEGDLSVIELAVQSGDLETVKICLDKSPSEEDILSAIELACNPDRLGILAELAKRPYFSIQSDLKIEGKPVLAYAYENNHWDLILALHEVASREGMDTFYKTLGPVIPGFLQAAAKRGHFDLIREVAERTDFLDMEDVEEGMPLILEAVRQHSWNFVNNFIEYSEEYPQVVVDGKPLAFALAGEDDPSKKGNAGALLTFIVAKDLPLLEESHEGESIISLVVKNRHWQVLELASQQGLDLRASGLSNQEVFNLVVEDLPSTSAWALCKELIIRGAKFDYVRIQGLPLLHYAVKSSSIEDVEKMLTAKAPVDQRDEFGRTALFYALELKDFEMAEALVKGGATIHAEDWNFTISQIAALKFIGKVSLFKDDPLWVKRDLDISIIAFLKGLSVIGNKDLVFSEGNSRAGLATPLYEALCHFQTQQVDAISEIPDTEYEGDAYKVLQSVFESFEDEDLEGVIGIDEKVVPVEDQKENFAHFLDITKHQTKIVGVVEGVSYIPIRRMVRHLAKKLPGLPKEEQLTLLTQISRIEKGYCIDPYKKVAQWIYGALESSSDQEQASVVDLGDPVVSLRRDLYAKMRGWRDIGMQEILGETRGEIDTHARNWAYKYFGPEIGLSFDEVDIHLEVHGLSMLALYLNKIESRDPILLELKTRFDNFFLGFAFQNIVRFLKREMASTDLVGLEETPKRDILIDYFHELVNLKKIQNLKKQMSLSGRRDEMQEYLKMKGSIKKLEAVVSGHESSLGRLEFMLKHRQTASVDESDQEAVTARKERIASSEAKIEEEKVALAQFKGELALAQEKFEAYKGSHKAACGAVDIVEAEAKVEHTAISETYLTYSEDGGTSISTEGCWEFFKLMAFSERTSL